MTKKITSLAFFAIAILMSGCVKQVQENAPATDNSKIENNPTLTVAVETEENKNYLIVNYNSERIVLDQGDTSNSENPTKIMKFENPRFSSLKNYVISDTTSYAENYIQVYDIKNRKMIERGAMVGFSNDEKYFYTCTPIGRGGFREAKVKILPDFETKLDVFGEIVSPETYEKYNDYNVENCFFDEKENKINIIINNGNETKTFYYPEKD